MALLRTTHKGPKSTRWSSLALEDGATALEQLAGAKLTPTLDRAPGVRGRRRDSVRRRRTGLRSHRPRRRGERVGLPVALADTNP
jgi:hypothetical protein